MASSQEKPGKHNGPEDAQIIVSIMKDLGIDEYDQQVLNHLLEFNYRNTTQLLEDAKSFSNFANKKQIDADDVKMAKKFSDSKELHRPPAHDKYAICRTNVQYSNDLYSSHRIPLCLSVRKISILQLSSSINSLSNDPQA
ncbi:PREDICTED: transcription initiation factor TFIID subunit 9B-like [Diuraphis noxia]|uniref:transcription initiation factor TFIID subunit 9B-like n=1 Tax=Diuraphis noxia TaxID=143948 RepID=UPI00076372CA|nr:PREDICTED: transcription initiation factor TFIID subunit 9B-like [Diuraphis noxia]